jgi:hypothetical protein
MMVFQATVVKVMIASPGDVATERRAAREVIHEWNAVHAADRRTVLLPIAWETNAAPAMGDRAQEIINKQLLRGADLLIAVFWTRLGTPTGMGKSGTIEEIEEHLWAGKPAMLYFSATPVRPDSVDEAQYRALREFKASVLQRGLVEEYESVSEFREKLARQLAQSIIQHFPAPPAEGGSTPLVPSPDTTGARTAVPDLSPEAGALLREAIQDPHGVVLMTLTTGGLGVETNGRDMIAEPSNPRAQAGWRAAVRELVERGLLEVRDLKGEVFEVTDPGYRVGELLG